MSTALLLGYEKVVLPPGCPGNAFRHGLDGLTSAAVRVGVAWRFRSHCADPDDEFSAEAAVAAGMGAAIITYDLGDLVPARALGVEVIRPAALLRRVEK